MKKKLFPLIPLVGSLWAVCGIFVGLLFVSFPAWRWVVLGAFGVVTVGCLLAILFSRRLLQKTVRTVTASLDVHSLQTLKNFPMPLLAFTNKGEIVFENQRFSDAFSSGDSLIGHNFYEVFNGVSPDDIKKKTAVNCGFGDYRLSGFVNAFPGEDTTVVYFHDTTALEQVAAEYTASRPTVLFIYVDNLDELTRSVKDTEYSTIVGQVQSLLDTWITQNGGILRKFGHDRFMAITENRRLTEMTRNRFAVLDNVRETFAKQSLTVTLSIGVGQGKTMQEGEQLARRALDMALARGGDQAAVKTKEGYDFYGGKSRGVERRAKVRSRVVANGLKELIVASDTVLIMGHRYSDLDSLGSGVALAAAIRRMGKRAFCVVNRSATMAEELICRYEAIGQGDLFAEPIDAEDYITDKTLLVITDTHTVPMLESEDIYNQCKTVAVIDHHRRMVNAIENTALSYQESAASSASEMVAELLSYLDENLITKIDAEALLAGIMLDTRNFVLRTGVRTFEAAALLRRMGADTVAVKRIFSDSLAVYQQKSRLVMDAHLFHHMAISVCKEETPDGRLVAAQAADELLTIAQTVASFVLYTEKRDVMISARSYGECNVQIIMEKLGGGGHLTMAGTRMNGVTVEEAETQLRSVIEEYCQENNLTI